MDLYFLEAKMPLVKTIVSEGNDYKVNPYPLAYHFSSHKEHITDLTSFRDAIVAHGAKGHSLIKGALNRDLLNESRAGSTDPFTRTHWLCLDLDYFDDESRLDVLLDSLGLSSVSYIKQYSSGHGITKRFSAHLFFLLSTPVLPEQLKLWLMKLNLESPLLEKHVSLTRTAAALRWPLDVSVAQNDKIIYIAPPTCVGFNDPVQDRVSIVVKTHNEIDISSKLVNIDASQVHSAKQRKLTELRKAKGLPARTFKTKTVAGVEVLQNPGETVITGHKEERGFMYLNLNGGDSWGYYHRTDNPEIIFNFKGEPNYLTRELLPSYYRAYKKAMLDVDEADKEKHFAFLDRRSDRYYRGTYFKEANSLELYPTDSIRKIEDFLKQKGQFIGEYIEEWDYLFRFDDDRVFIPEERFVNQYQITPVMREAKTLAPTAFPPTIKKVLESVSGNDEKVLRHLLNWMATIVQTRQRTQTMWVMHGVPGCIAGDTPIQYNRGKRSSARTISMKEFYEKFNGLYEGPHKWESFPITRIKSFKGEAIGFHEVYQVVESGIQPVYKLTTVSGRSIRATYDHPFMREDGQFVPMSQLHRGTKIAIEGSPNTHKRGRKGRKKGRVTIYSIPYHPVAWRHVIGGKNYKRLHKARLIYEAHINGLELEEMIQILRSDPVKAANLKYLPADIIVHHVNEDPTDDRIENLTLIDKLNHDRHHAKETGFGTISVAYDEVESIEYECDEMTYDITMKAPYHNFLAGDFIVSNTGKGVLVHEILAPILGPEYVQVKSLGAIEEEFNAYMERCVILMIDESKRTQIQNQEKVMAKLKQACTDPVLPIRKMRADPYMAKNYMNIIVASNYPDPISIEAGDRRINVANYQPNKLWLSADDIATLRTEVPAFAAILMKMKIDVEQAKTPLQNAAREKLMYLTQTSLDTVFSAIRDGNLQFFIDDLPSGEVTTTDPMGVMNTRDFVAVLREAEETARRGEPHKLTRDQARALAEFTLSDMPRTANKFSALAKHYGVTFDRMSKGGAKVQGMEVRWRQPEVGIDDVMQTQKLRAVK